MPFLIASLVALISAALLTGLAEGMTHYSTLSFSFSSWHTLAGLLSGIMATGAYALQAKNNGKALDEAKHPLQGDRKSGKVKWFNTKKGFGFIQCENGEEIFVHYRSIISSGHRILREGEQVSFIISDTEKGPQAENVQKEG